MMEEIKIKEKQDFTEGLSFDNNMGMLENNLFNDYEARMMKYQGLLELTRVITSTLEETKLHQIILYACHGQFLIQNASLILATEGEDQQYENVLSTGLKEDKYDISFSSNSAIIELFTKEDQYGHLVMEKKPHLAMQVFRDLGWSKDNNPLKALKADIIIPLWGRSSFLGLFILGPKLDNSNFPTKELGSLAQFAELAAVSIENAHLFDMAVLDKMTGLFNHHFFKTCLSSEMDKSKKYNQPLSLILCDLDHFKNVNDTYGHQVGDFILKTFSRVMKRVLGGKYIAARYGGEEFAIILSNVTLDDTLVIAEKIRTSFMKLHYRTKKGEFFKTASMGITQFKPTDNITITELIEQADKCLYESKETGRNKITVHQRS